MEGLALEQTLNNGEAWVTDAAWLQGGHKLALASADHSVRTFSNFTL